LKAAFFDFRQRGQVQEEDEFWVFLDSDHHIRDTNLAGTLEALRTATQTGFEIAISNPCFELWLLLHHAEVPPKTVFAGCSAVVVEIKKTLGGYNKTSIKAGAFPLACVPAAIRRARALEAEPDDPVGRWPQQAGTRVYRLLERVMTRMT
jgi:RloB-like protein